MKNAVALIKRHKKALLFLGALIALLYINGRIDQAYFNEMPIHLRAY